MAKLDLQDIHDMLRDNHPGAVDPLNRDFATWLLGGLDEAKKRASKAASFADYRRALQFYVNGFREGHIQLNWNATLQSVAWPGILVSSPGSGRVIVAHKADDVSVPLGAELRSCDGKSIDALLKERTDPFVWNADMPHIRYSFADRLFWGDPDDRFHRLESCTFMVEGVQRVEKLVYRNQPRSELSALLAKTAAPRPAMGIRKLGNMSIVAIPNFWDDEAVKKLLAELKDKVPELRKDVVIFDVRGNGGGNSGWGDEVVKLFWGDFAAPYRAQLDHTFEARASTKNIEHVRQIAKRFPSNGLESVAQRMEQAQKERKPYARFSYPPRAIEGPVRPNPVGQKVYLLTDNRCYSACLNFADVLLQIPGVTHIGETTGADAIYIDIVSPRLLPSGLTTLAHSYKVYRNRKRGHNQAYEPRIKWPGGVMSDEALVKWVATLG
jgi:hypothetical protein